MKAIMISIKPKWCVKIMNGDKTIEIRKNKALANAIQKLIDENGYADIYVYCSKYGGNLVYGTEYRSGSFIDEYGITRGYSKQKADKIFGLLNGKVLFKFRCYNVDKLFQAGTYFERYEEGKNVLKNACLDIYEFEEYRKGKSVYAIHISDLEIFDRPRELSEFEHWVFYEKCEECPYGKSYDCSSLPICCEIKPLTKAPQNFCYVEVEENE